MFNIIIIIVVISRPGAARITRFLDEDSGDRGGEFT